MGYNNNESFNANYRLVDKKSIMTLSPELLKFLLLKVGISDLTVHFDADRCLILTSYRINGKQIEKEIPFSDIEAIFTMPDSALIPPQD